jgi:hypothetical protein
MLNDKRCSEFGPQGKLQSSLVLLGLLVRAGPARQLLCLLLAFLESSSLVSLVLGLLVVIVGGRHIKTVNAAILVTVLRAPLVLAPLVFNLVPFLCDLPLGAASLGLTFTAAVRLAAACLVCAFWLVLVERHLLGQILKLLLDFLKSRGESDNFSVFLVCVQPGPIRNHVVMHLIQLLDDLSWIGYFFHDPLALELVNKGEKLLSWGRLKGTEKVSDETLVCVRVLACLGIDFLKNRHHARGEKMDVVLMRRPESNSVELFLKMADFHNYLGLANIKHLAHQDEA